jgi:hypothetical protein
VAEGTRDLIHIGWTGAGLTWREGVEGCDMGRNAEAELLSSVRAGQWCSHLNRDKTQPCVFKHVPLARSRHQEMD